jgi:hypothetical protein
MRTTRSAILAYATHRSKRASYRQHWLCSRPRRAGAQSQEHRRGDSPRCAGCLHWRLGVWEILASFRHALRRGAAAVFGIGRAYARRLFHQIGPEVDEIEGLPPAVALQQQRGSPTTRSSVGSVTTLSNLLRMLYSRAGDYPRNQQLLYAESFSPNTPDGACPRCHGLGRIYEVTERSMVPDDSLSIAGTCFRDERRWLRPPSAPP